MLKNSGNPGSVVAQGPRFPGGVGVVFQLASMGEPRFLLEQPSGISNIVSSNNTI